MIQVMLCQCRVSCSTEAVDVMEPVEVLSEKEVTEKEAKTILFPAIVVALLFEIPCIGEAGLVASGALTIVKIVSIAVEAAQVAFEIFGIVDNPESVLMEVIGLSMGTAGITFATRDAMGFAKMGAVRSKFRMAEIAKWGGQSFGRMMMFSKNFLGHVKVSYCMLRGCCGVHDGLA